MTAPTHCLNCEQTKDDAEHELEKMRMHLHGLQRENEQLVQDYEIVGREHRRTLRRLNALERKLNDDQGSATRDIRELCEYHAKLWKERFPRATGLSYDMKDPSALAFRKALRTQLKMPEALWDRLGLDKSDDRYPLGVQDVKEIMDVIFSTDFYRAKRTYMQPASFLGNADKMGRHFMAVLVRRQHKADIERLREQGFKDPEALVASMRRCEDCGQVQCVCPPVVVAQDANGGGWRVCPGCGSPGACWSGCPVGATMRSAA